MQTCAATARVEPRYGQVCAVVHYSRRRVIQGARAFSLRCVRPKATGTNKAPQLPAESTKKHGVLRASSFRGGGEGGSPCHCKRVETTTCAGCGVNVNLHWLEAAAKIRDLRFAENAQLSETRVIVGTQFFGRCVEKLVLPTVGVSNDLFPGSLEKHCCSLFFCRCGIVSETTTIGVQTNFQH